MNENKIRSWVKGVGAAFLCATAAVGLAFAGGQSGQSAATNSAVQSMSSGYVPPGMHEAEAGADVGLGSDEAQAATSPSAR